MNEEKVKLRLNIAGESLMLSVPYSQQEATRRTEAELNMLYDTWRARFPEKSDRELLAMIAFRYAERHAALMREREEALGEAERAAERISTLLEAGERD